MTTAQTLDFRKEREIQQLAQALRADPAWTSQRIRFIREEIEKLLGKSAGNARNSA